MWAVVIPDVLDCEPFVRTLMTGGVEVLLVLIPRWTNTVPGTAMITVPDLFDAERLFGAVSDFFVSRGIGRESLVGVYAFSERGVDARGCLRKKFGLPGGDVERFRNKWAMRELAAEPPPLRAPRHYLVGSPEAEVPVEFLEACESRNRLQPGSPLAVRKPLSSSSSRGIIPIYTISDLRAAAAGAGEPYLIEEYIAGDLYHVGGVVWAGRCLMEVAARHAHPLLDISLGIADHSVLQTLDLAGNTAVQLLALAGQVRARFKLDEGMFEIEFLRSAATGEFYLCEIAARPVASRILFLQEALYREDPYVVYARQVVAASYGQSSGEIQPPTRLDGVTAGIVIFKCCPGRVVSLTPIDQSLGPGIERAEQYARPGTVFPERSSANRLGYIATIAATEAEVSDRLARYQSAFRYVMAPLEPPPSV